MYDRIHMDCKERMCRFRQSKHVTRIMYTSLSDEVWVLPSTSGIDASGSHGKHLCYSPTFDDVAVVCVCLHLPVSLIVADSFQVTVMLHGCM